MKILVTGAAGFIGFHLSKKLASLGHEVVGIDNFSPYYDVRLKKDRLSNITQSQAGRNFSFHEMDLCDTAGLRDLFQKQNFTHVVNLAAQAGVRYSLENPASYIQSNITGFANLLELCRLFQIEHLVYASSSSVYGMNGALPYSPSHNVDHPASLYAATKKSNELMAHSYSHNWRLPTTGLRFFTVYGPWGRPDMSPYLFASAILSGAPLRMFNHGHLRRDFTYIDDIIEGVAAVLPKAAAPDPDFDPAAPDPATSSAPWRIYNIGNTHAVELGEYVAIFEEIIGKKANIEYLPMQPGDVKATWADIKSLAQATGFTPKTSLKEGLAKYIQWHKEYYGQH